MLLENKVAIVTGGTRGIGYATVKEFLKQGAKVALFGSREETVRVALEKLREENPDYPVIGLYPNLMDTNEVKEAFQKVVHEFGHLDVLVNNAGISQRDKIFDYNIEDFEKIMNLNVNAVFVCSKEAAHIMKEQGGGVILNTSSMVSLYGQPAGAGYPTSKFAVNGMTKSLAENWKRSHSCERSSSESLKLIWLQLSR
ncbi:MAG: SDR family NAD(P)-dependent oxidoreductase [Longibaculum sp.]